MQDTSLDSSEEVRGLIRAGRAAVRLGDYEAARTTFERAVTLDPANLEAQDGLRDVQRRLGIAAQERGGEKIEYCYRHPEVETGLHCTQCSRPICVRCSHPAAVGQLCPECRRGRRAPNYQVSAGSLAKGGAVALIVSALVAAFTGLLPFFLWLFIGAAIAEFVIRTVDSVTRSKRGRPMQIVVSAGLIIGALIGASVSPLGGGIGLLLYLFLVVGTAIARLR